MNTLTSNLGTIFVASITNVWNVFINFVPAVLLAIVLFVIGLIIARIIGKVIAQLITTTKVDKLFQSAGAEEFLNKIGIRLNVGKFFGVIVEWFIAIVFLIASLEILQLTEVSRFIGQIVIIYLPKVIIIAILLILAVIIANTVKKIVLVSSKAANVKSAEILSSLAKYGIWVIAFTLIAPYLGLDTGGSLFSILFIGIISFLSIAGGLAFGLGGKEAAARAIEKISKDLSSN